ncbi:hypothetical protein CAEBREN_06630 [Caenorhabditis brenneri]|uniref:Uncharacterized protein n=1 Tax=Caenorhabditis brenneri TaxID=135651 RepID=G0MJC1_CAEBE|nr:hypothetical protein CAEBREN_06630 [Caenorhabditis brenneri]
MFSSKIFIALLLVSVILVAFTAEAASSSCEEKLATLARTYCDHECVKGFQERVEEACTTHQSLEEIQQLCCFDQE